MNNHGIRGRVLLLALLPLALVAFALTWHAVQARQGDIEKALEERALAVARQLAQACEYGLFSGERDTLLRQARFSQISAGASAVSIVDPEGRELLRLGLPRLKPAWSSSQVGGVFRDAETLLVSAPVMQTPIAPDYVLAATTGHNLLGFVALEIPRRETLDRQREVLLTSLAFTLLGLGIASLLAWRLGRDIVRPISRLTEAVERIGAGDLDARVTVDAGGEFVVLERGINRMAAELHASYDNLQEKIRVATEELAWRADHDPLTGLLNRGAFDVALRLALARGDNDCQQALLYLDLDRFKAVNDTGGHLAGDELLRQFAALVGASMGERDQFARLGGDEFAILLADCDQAAAERRAWALCRRVLDHRFQCLGQAYQIGVSIGVVMLGDAWRDVDKLMSAVDGACYAAKADGRGQVRVFPETRT